jgi:hypothetical protein
LNSRELSAILLAMRLFPLILLLAFAATACNPKPRALAPEDVPRALAASLVDWRILGGMPDRQSDGTTLHETFAHEMKGVHGTVQGEREWYEVELSDPLELELRARLEGSNAIDKAAGFEAAPTAPEWWPKEWPEGTRFYTRGTGCFVLLEAGTRAWFARGK